MSVSQANRKKSNKNNQLAQVIIFARQENKSGFFQDEKQKVFLSFLSKLNWEE